MTLPLTTEQVINHINKVGKQFIVEYDNSFEEEDKKKLNEVHKTIGRMLHSKNTYINIHIAISPNQQIIYELMEYYYKSKGDMT